MQRSNKGLSEVLALIDRHKGGLGREIRGVIHSTVPSVEEIRLRRGGVSSIRIGGRDLPLSSRISDEGMDDMVVSLCHGALYAYRDSIIDGYIHMDGGVRVGIGGHAGYEGGRCVGVNDVSSLVFRIPSGVAEFAEELYRSWVTDGMGGMLIVSPPAGGKTTVLRSLAHYVGSYETGVRTVIVDERCEIDREDYLNSQVDVLSGYKRHDGIEIAVRTMSAEVLMCDEIFSDKDADALAGALGAGITVIATAHGKGMDDVMKRENVKRLIDLGMFDTLVSITRSNSEFGYIKERAR